MPAASPVSASVAPASVDLQSPPCCALLSRGRVSRALLSVGLGLGLGGCGIFEKVYDTSLASGSGGGLAEVDSGGLSDVGAEGGDRPGEDGRDPSDDGDDGDEGGDEGDDGSEGSDGGESGGDSGGESGGDSGGTSLVDCTPGAVPATGNVDECVSQAIACGQTIVATTQGGTNYFNDDMYVDWTCTPTPDGQYAGAEKVFALEVPLGQTATITLEAPCEDLDVMALRWEFWERDGECPYPGISLVDCEMDEGRGGGEIVVTADFNDPSGEDPNTSFLVVVEGPDGEQTPFALSVACE